MGIFNFIYFLIISQKIELEIRLYLYIIQNKVCLTPRVSSFDMPTKFDRIWDIEKTKLKKEFNEERIAVSNFELFCYMANLKTNRDVMNLVMEDLDSCVEEDGYDEIWYLDNTKTLKKHYEEYDKKNKLDIPIDVVNDDNIVIHLLLTSAMYLRDFKVDCKDERFKQLLKEYYDSKFDKIENKTYTYEFIKTNV